ncbi:MAG: polA operon protein (DNA-binding protein) [Parcubacteria group bacterium Gr01-1014_8]|nr:MAG: polA operon protein (DNA-binding protein) [Parcubacteria group bacterium Gr01-1014_8]
MKEREVTERGQYVLRLIKDEDVLLTLEDFCARKGILSGSFRAIGAVKEAKIGYYDLASKKYGSKVYLDEMEVASMTGNVAQVDGKPFIHVHAVLSGMKPGSENQPVAGHVFEAIVAVTLEVQLTAFNENISREFDDDIGLKLLNI